MQHKDVTLITEDIETFASGSKLEAKLLKPLENTHGRILLLRCDESTRAHSRVTEIIGAVNVDPVIDFDEMDDP
jgi:hypothetical protein